MLFLPGEQRPQWSACFEREIQCLLMRFLQGELGRVFAAGDGIAELSRSPFGDGSAFCCLAGPQSKVSRCQPNEYNCLGTELCIHMSKLCNGLHDCFDGSDEGPHCRGRCLGGMAVKEILPLPPFLPCHGQGHKVPVCPVSGCMA